MAGTQLPGIVKESGPLSEEWHGGEFPGRTEKHKELLEGLTPLPGERDLARVWLHGPPGTGKTSAIRRVLGKMEERGTRTAYVNCWSAQTFFAVMEAIFQELRAVVGDQRDVAFKYERLEWRRHSEKGPRGPLKRDPHPRNQDGYSRGGIESARSMLRHPAQEDSGGDQDVSVG